LPITSNTSHILYVSKVTKIGAKKKAKTLQEFEIFRQKSWQNHTVPSQLNSLEYIVFLHIIKVGFRKTSLSQNIHVLAFKYIINVTEVWTFCYVFVKSSNIFNMV